MLTPGGHAHVLASAPQPEFPRSSGLVFFFTPFQAMPSPTRVPGQFFHKLKLLLGGEPSSQPQVLQRVTAVTASQSGNWGQRQFGGEANIVSFQQGRNIPLERQDAFSKHKATTAVGDIKCCIKMFHFIAADRERDS